MQNDLKANKYQNIGEEAMKLGAYKIKHVYYHINEVQLVGKKKGWRFEQSEYNDLYVSYGKPISARFGTVFKTYKC